MPNQRNSLITVIIATTAETKRKAQIEAALKSIADQDIGKVKICVVVNGTIFDQEVIEQIKAFPHVEYHYLTQGDFPEALAYARRQITSPFFAFLDDDDLLTTYSLSLRLAPMLEDEKISVCVGNGIRVAPNQTIKMFKDFKLQAENPLRSLLKPNGNWLASCAGLFRSAQIDEEFFNDYARYTEWTYLAFKIASQKKIKFINSKCYKINYTPNSLSSGEKYILGQLHSLNKILNLQLPKDVKKVLKLKRVRILHDLSDHFRIHNNKFESLKYHLLSISSLGGYQYLAYTRHLIHNRKISSSNN